MTRRGQHHWKKSSLWLTVSSPRNERQTCRTATRRGTKIVQKQEPGESIGGHSIHCGFYEKGKAGHKGRFRIGYFEQFQQALEA